ncbi:MAG: LTA synthase family protein [Myxococcales bacterium]|nr:LTA synthase family protein [Myxococcales bacterium]
MLPFVICFAAGAAVAALAGRVSGVRRRPWATWILRTPVPLLLAYGSGLVLTVIVAERAQVPLRDSDYPLVFSAAAVPMLPVALSWGRGRAVAAGLVCVLLGVLALTDILTLRGLDTLPSLVTVTGIGNVWSVRHSIRDLFEPGDAVVAVLPAAGAALFALASLPRPVPPFWPLRVVRACVPPLLCAVLLWPLTDRVRDFMDSRFSWKVFRVTDWVSSGVITAHAYDVSRSVREMASMDGLSHTERASVAAYYRSRAKEVSALRDRFGVARGANVLILQVEALQQWVIGARFRGQPVTPFLNGLQRDGAIYFSHIFDQTGPAATTNCEYAVMASQHPLAVGATAFRRPNNDFVSLPKVLKRAGYGTYSAHAFHRGYWNRASFHPQLGIEESFFRRELGKGERIGWGLSDELFLKRALERLKERRQPLFGLLVTLTSHHPYGYIPASKRRLRGVTGLGSLGGYLHSMRYVDDSLRAFFRLLARSPLGDNTLVVVYGDHDSRLRFDGARLTRIQKSMPNRRAQLRKVGSRAWVADRIPLFFVLPKRSQSGEVTTVGGQIDIAPTILHYLGIERPTAFLGRPLLAGRQGFVARMDGSAAVSGIALSSRGKQRCTSLRGRSLNAAKCESLDARAQQELSMSWAVTLNDLFQGL